MVEAERTSKVANAAISFSTETCYGTFHWLEPKRTRACHFRCSIEQMYGTHVRSLVDPGPKVNWIARALTVLFEGEVAWEAEFLFEVSRGLWRSHSVRNESQGVKG